MREKKGCSGWGQTVRNPRASIMCANSTIHDNSARGVTIKARDRAQKHSHVPLTPTNLPSLLGSVPVRAAGTSRNRVSWTTIEPASNRFWTEPKAGPVPASYFKNRNRRFRFMNRQFLFWTRFFLTLLAGSSWAWNWNGLAPVRFWFLIRRNRKPPILKQGSGLPNYN